MGKGCVLGLCGLVLTFGIAPARAADDSETLRRQVVSVLGPPGRGACTGVVIGRDRVLTAAHCLVAPASAYRVEMIGPDGAVHSHQVVSHRRHPSFNRAALEHDGNGHDLAILKLRDPLPPDARPAKIGGVAGKDAKVVAVGMEGGYFSRLSNRLRVMRLAVAGGHSDRLMLEPTAGGGGQPCHGDSGGPVFQRTARGWSLVAIISWGNRRCNGETAATILGRYRPFLGS